MDRDRRWERTQLAYDAIVEGDAQHRAETGEAAVRAAYERGETDEFIVPTLVGEEGRVREGDAVVFFNFRPDRARQLCEKLGPHVDLTTLTEYHEDWDYPVAFPPERPPVTLASYLAERGISQLHVAETEKYAHVTYFFNGGEEDPYQGEERSLVDSPRDVPDLRQEAGDERARGRRARSSSTGRRTTTASGSSTSRTPTWSGTPARSRRP